MKITVQFDPYRLDELDLREKYVVVIDVLRASTTIIYAMNAGAREVIPVESVAAAMKIVGNLFSTSTLLCGERGAKKIEGFHLGNSPAEYTPEIVEGKSLILTTTNGAVALVKSRYAKRCLIGAFVNLSAVADHIIADHPDELTILCSGRDRDFSLEDALCAGLLIEHLMRSEIVTDLTDGAKTSLTLYHRYGIDLFTAMKESDHGKRLVELGAEDDIRIASVIDSVPIVPVLIGASIRSH